ncbi:unnamed protein product [Meloidogyne enterolobii]|uniref:Uncharacterized protein n=1 Tax=Meloidogyne enterolobii TaxID=390850 RepID=A0ACB1AK48_MELEN
MPWYVSLYTDELNQTISGRPGSEHFERSYSSAVRLPCGTLGCNSLGIISTHWSSSKQAHYDKYRDLCRSITACYTNNSTLNISVTQNIRKFRE